VLGALGAAGGIVGLLGNADRAQRARLYTELGVTLDYERETPTERVHVRSQLSGEVFTIGPELPQRGLIWSTPTD
jgi:hypothetical protein